MAVVIVFLVVAHEVDVVGGSASGSGASSCCSSENICLNV